jgi:branched-subunit amino acid transport protein
VSRSDAVVWAAIVAVGLGTFGLRFSFLYLEGRTGGIPPAAERALRFVPPAVLAALVLPAVVVSDGSVALVGNDRLVAGVAAALVAWRTEDILATIAAGVGALLALGLLL